MVPPVATMRTVGRGRNCPPSTAAGAAASQMPTAASSGRETPMAMAINPRLLYRIRRAAMRMREPADERFERLARGGAVEGHQGGRNAGVAGETGSPTPSQSGCHFNDVPLAADGFFETVSGHGLMALPASANSGILVSRPNRSSEGEHECRVHRPPPLPAAGRSVRNEIALAGDPRNVHRSSTAFPPVPSGRVRKWVVERFRERGARIGRTENAP